MRRTLRKGFSFHVFGKCQTRYTDLNTYIHPWNNKTCCEPDCETATNSGRIVAGCPKCWAASKKWASVLAFGTNHTFDAVIKDKISGKTLVVEAKFITARGGRMPNGEIQRLLGQCLLAKTKHDFVIGLCGRKGVLTQDGTTIRKLLRTGPNEQELILYSGLLTEFTCLEKKLLVTMDSGGVQKPQTVILRASEESLTYRRITIRSCFPFRMTLFKQPHYPYLL